MMTAEATSNNRLYTHRELVSGGVPDIDWLVRALMPKESICCLAGDSGVGKSWVAYHLAQTLAAGLPFLGRFTTQQQRVAILDAESGPGLVKRRMGKLWGGLLESGPPLDSDLPLSVFPGAYRFDTDDRGERFAEWLNRVGFQVVILDPLVHFFSGGNENDAGTVAAFFEVLRHIQGLTGVTFVVVHHSRKQSNQNSNAAGQMLRGSSAIRGVLDSHLFLRRLKNGKLLCEHDKSRHAERLADFLIEITDTSETTTTICYAGDDLTSEVPKTELAETVALRTLADMGGVATRQQLLSVAQVEGVTTRTMDRALQKLVETRVVSRGAKGKTATFSLLELGLEP